MLWFSAYQCELYAALVASSDETLSGVAVKAVKEVDYHRDHAATGCCAWATAPPSPTSGCRRRSSGVAPYVAELFEDDAVSVAAAEAGAGVLPSSLWPAASAATSSRVVAEATLTMPAEPTWRSRGGRDGIHSRPMGYLLAEMQHIARSHPGATW